MDKVVTDINVLRQKSEQVQSVEEAQDIIAKLEDALRPISHGVGLAAIQVGIPKTVGVIKDKSKKRGDFLHLINPVLVNKEDEFVFLDEGCLSFPDMFRNTKRYKQYTITHQRIEDDHFEEETLCFYYNDDNGDMNSDGLLAIAVQHEMEHFNGELIIDSEADQSLKL